jgi:hypothetical protein
MQPLKNPSLWSSTKISKICNLLHWQGEDGEPRPIEIVLCKSPWYLFYWKFDSITFSWFFPLILMKVYNLCIV